MTTVDIPRSQAEQRSTSARLARFLRRMPVHGAVVAICLIWLTPSHHHQAPLRSD